MPEKIAGTNMWRLFEGECITGIGGTIVGPIIVRVYEYPDLNRMLVQVDPLKVEVEGTSFEAVVYPCPPPTPTSGI